MCHIHYLYSAMILLVFCVLISACEFVNSARILGIVATPSYSHQVVFQPIWRELSRRGHDVVVITTDPENDPELNLTEIDISFAYDLCHKKHNCIKKMEEYQSNPIKAIKAISNATLDISNQELLHPDVQALLKNDTEHFDLILVEFMFPIMFAFAERFKCPFIGIFTMDLLGFYHSLLGNPTHPVLHPDLALPFDGKLTFFQRLISSIYRFAVFPIFRILGEGFDDIAYRRLMEDHFGKGLPSLLDIIRNVDMVFLNVNPSFYTRPLGPSFVTIGGGIHLTSTKSLPKDLQEYLDGAKNGVIYFSLGTNVKSVMIPPEMRKIMLDTFRELPYRVLWKFDVTDIPDVPENVKIVEWLPQQDILRHPNIKVFITQGGLQSTEEAIFSNVPVVGIPFIGDQEGNVQKIVKKGFGVYLDKTKLTKESFKEAILEVINNPKYKEKTIEVAELSRDQPMTGLEKAVWWTEYVIRHKGARHFRNPAIDLPTYQYYLLDVIGFILAVLSIFIFISYKIIVYTKRLIVRIFSSIFSKKVKKQ